MKLLLFLKSNILIFFILFSFAVINYSFAESQKNPSIPSFSIYLEKTPLYATLSGNFTFYPDGETQKVETFLKNKKLPKNTAFHSSYLSIKFDNKVYKFNDLKEVKSEWNIEEHLIYISGFIPNVNVEVFMILKNIPDKNESFYISYGAINKTNKIVDVGFRSLIDIGVEDNEGIPLKICTDNTTEKEIYSNEYKFTPYKSSYWETYSAEINTIGIRNYFTGNKNTPPDQIAFANWEKAFLSEWKYFTNKDISTTPDSAVLLWWNPRPVKSGEKLEITTEFEIKKNTGSVFFELIDSVTGNGRLHLKTKNETNYPKEVSYLIDAGEHSFTALNRENPMKFILEPNSVFDKIIPITLHGRGEIPLSIKETNGKSEANYNLSVRLSQENRNQSPKFWKSSKYPIIYNSDKDGLKLKGIVRAKDSGKKLGESELISVKSIQNSFVYLGEVDLKEFNGEVLVEIFKQ